MRFLLLLTLLCACTTPRGGGDDDDSGSDDDDAAATEPWVDDDSVIASLEHGGASPCPDPMGWITLVNPLAEDIDFSVGQGPNVNGASILTFSPAALGEGDEGKTLDEHGCLSRTLHAASCSVLANGTVCRPLPSWPAKLAVESVSSKRKEPIAKRCKSPKKLEKAEDPETRKFQRGVPC